MKIPLVLLATWFFMAAASAVSYGAEKAAAEASAKATPIPIVCEVLSAEGKPVAGAKVYVSCPSSRDRMLDDPIIAQGTTDAEGIFRASYTAPAHWKVFYATVVVDGGKDGIGVGSVFHYPPRPSPDKYPIKLQPTTEFTATILTSEGKPAADLEVWIDYFALAMPGDMAGRSFSTEVSRMPGTLWKARTDPTGKCMMPMVPQGASLFLKHSDPRWAQFTGRYDLMVKPLAKADGTEAQLQLSPPGSIRGRLLLPDGSPAGGSIVSILDGVHPYVTAYGGEAKVDEKGEFLIAQIPPSTYKLYYDTQPPHYERWIGSEKEGVVVTAGKTTDLGDLVVTEAAHITGEVVDAETGKVIEEPLIFRIAAGQHELRYRSMRYPGPGYYPPGSHEAVPVQVKGGERKTVAFKLVPVKPGEMVTGVVLNEKGEPVEKAAVAMMGEGDMHAPTMAVTDKAGKFTLTREKNARREMLLAWSDKAMCDSVPLVPGQPMTLKLREKGWGRVIGTVVDTSGNRIADAQISWFLPESVVSFGPVPNSTRSDAQGRFEYARMWTRKDGVTFFCKAEGYGSGSLRDQTVKADATTELKFTLGVADQFVAGTVVDAEGKPAAGVSVYASGTGQPGNARSITDAKGRFRIEKLVAGKVSVRAYHKTQGSTREARKWANANDVGVRLQLPETSGEVTGVVVDAAGKPVPMARVESYARGRKTSADKDGKFKLSGLVQGWFTVDVQSVNEKGELLKRSLRLKPGMKDAKITLPAKNKEEPALPVDPVDLVGKPAAEVKIATWVNCEPLPAMGRGKVRILDFWGMECAPCIASFPKVQQFWEAHRGKGIEFLATSSFYPVEEVKEFLAKHPSYTFPVALRGDDSSADLDYDIRGVPTYVVIDAFGKIVSKGHDFEEAAKVALGLVGK